MDNLKDIYSLIAPELDAMNDLIRRRLATDNELLNSIVTNYLSQKGKQLRPVMVILSGRMFGTVSEDTIAAAAALEMLHNASLIHDDVVDNTSLRRGKPTINSDFGNSIAVLTGDFFVSNALSTGISTGNIDVISALADLGKELSLGEIQQICNVREHTFDEQSYYSMITKKTASLFRNCVRMGASTNGVSRKEAEPLEKYGEILGICFQIKDDILDYVGDKKIGKPTGNDLREGKVTLPLLYAIASAPEDEAGEIKKLIAANNLTDADINMLTTYAIEHGGIDYAFRKMREMQQEAQKYLDAYPDNPQRKAFSEIFDFIIERNF